MAEGKNIEFQYDLPKSLPSLTADSLKIEQALENIVLNSIQAITDKGVIKIKTEESVEPHAAVKITISEDGTGISSDNLKNIFYPFFTTKGPQTKGLGLSIADLIVRQHGGEIKVRSKPKEETTVSIELPLL